jgi:hypothetical protein
MVALSAGTLNGLFMPAGTPDRRGWQRRRQHGHAWPQSEDLDHVGRGRRVDVCQPLSFGSGWMEEHNVAMTGAQPTRVLVLDVDGVVSPVHPVTSAWGDDVVAGDFFSPVKISPRLCARLDQLNRMPGLSCCWLTSWTAEMRAGMEPFPGRDWLTIAEQADVAATGRRWWKLVALEEWLDRHPQICELAWCDDHLRPARRAAVRRRLAARGLDPLMLMPAPELGLTPLHLDLLVRWASATVVRTHSPFSGGVARVEASDQEAAVKT